ncbi:YcdB/YcdC domain-containing protein [Brevibacillus laterosporus]
MDTQKLSMQSSSSYKQSQIYQWEDDTEKRGRIEVNTFSGQLLEYAYKPEINHTSSQINKVEAQQKAIALLKYIVPTQIKELYLDTSEEMTTTSSITFTLYPSYEGVPVISHPYHVTVDMDTGTITNYQGSPFDPESLPKNPASCRLKRLHRPIFRPIRFS